MARSSISSGRADHQAPALACPAKRLSPELLDDVDQFVGFVALCAGVVEEFFGTFGDGALLRGAGYRDAAAASELEQAFVAELAERTQDGVGVDAEYGSEIFGGRQSLAGLGLTVRDRAADLAGDLFVELERIVAVDLDTTHGASHSSVFN